jgi:hypothetical protein
VHDLESLDMSVRLTLLLIDYGPAGRIYLFLKFSEDNVKISSSILGVQKLFLPILLRDDGWRSREAVSSRTIQDTLYVNACARRMLAEAEQNSC